MTTLPCSHLDTAELLPEAIRIRTKPELLLRRHLYLADAPTSFRVWLKRRVSHLLENDVCPSKVELIVTRLRWVFHDLLCFLVFAAHHELLVHIASHVEGAFAVSEGLYRRRRC